MKKLIIFSLIFILNLTYAKAEPIQANITYNEATARVEAFKNIERKIDKDFYFDFLIDKNKEENINSIKNKIYEIKERYLCPFYIKEIFASYAITYFDRIDNVFYYNTLGKLIKFDIITGDVYPRKILSYSKNGNLISVTFEVSEVEQFVYKENGKLAAHWVDNKLKDANKLYKLLEIKRGEIE